MVASAFDGLGSAISSGFTWLYNSLKPLFDGITSVINSVLTAIGNGFDSIGNTLTNLATATIDFVVGFWDHIRNAVVELFQPDPNILQNRLDDISNAFQNRFPLFSQINLSNLTVSSDTIKIPLLHGAQIDLSWFIPYAPYFKGLMSAYLYFIVVMYFVRNVKEFYS